MRVYLVNHCQSAHTVENKIGGWYDTRLTGLGIRHAKAVADRLRCFLADSERRPQLFSSDLLRAQETAEHVALAIGSDVRLRQELREMSMGVAEGESTEWLEEHGQPPPLNGDPLHYKACRGSESRFELAARVYPFVKELVKREEPETVIVTHSGTHDVLVGAWLGLPPETLGRLQFAIYHGGISRLTINPDGTRVVTALNDHAHLELPLP
jgi:probable phosphoglycerate mutase